MDLWIVFLNGVAQGVAQAKDAETLIASVRASMLGSLTEADIVEAVNWKIAEADDMIRAGLGTIINMTLAAQAMAMQRARPGLIR